MVRKLIRVPATTKAAVAVLAASAILLWHVLACTESPMAFSPNGKDLAFVTLGPYGTNADISLAGPRCYRLIVVSNRKTIRVLEQTTDAMLTAPGYSPDGSELCYLRLRLFSPEELDQLHKIVRGRREALAAAASRPAASKPASGMTSAPASVMKEEDRTLPSITATTKFGDDLKAIPPTTAELVFRRTSDYSVRTTIPIKMCGIDWASGNSEGSALLSYVTLQPQYSGDGKWVCLCAGGVLQVVNPEEKVQRFLAAPATAAVFSPDGKTVAFLHGSTVGFVQSDGARATYVQMSGTVSPSGLAWVDKETLAVLNTTEASRGTDGKLHKQTIVGCVKADGTTASRAAVTLPMEEANELAVSRDGKHMVVTSDDLVSFLDGRGNVVKTIEQEKDATSQAATKSVLAQPTFSPDSKCVALRRVQEKTDSSAIVFFTPDGKDLSRVEIPPIPPGTTRPASQPAVPAASRP